MGAVDLTARVTEWAQEAINTAAMGEEFPFTIQNGAMPVPGGQLPVLIIVVMMRHPLAGHLPLRGRITVPANIAMTGDPAPVRQQVHEAMGKLRAQFQAILHPPKQNGAGVVPFRPAAPGKLAGN